jgi:hypothetical protein
MDAITGDLMYVIAILAPFIWPIFLIIPFLLISPLGFLFGGIAILTDNFKDFLKSKREAFQCNKNK